MACNCRSTTGSCNAYLATTATIAVHSPHYLGASYPLKTYTSESFLTPFLLPFCSFFGTPPDTDTGSFSLSLLDPPAP